MATTNLWILGYKGNKDTLNCVTVFVSFTQRQNSILTITSSNFFCFSVPDGSMPGWASSSCFPTGCVHHSSLSPSYPAVPSATAAEDRTRPESIWDHSTSTVWSLAHGCQSHPKNTKHRELKPSFSKSKLSHETVQAGFYLFLSGSYFSNDSLVLSWIDFWTSFTNPRRTLRP